METFCMRVSVPVRSCQHWRPPRSSGSVDSVRICAKASKKLCKRWNWGELLDLGRPVPVLSGRPPGLYIVQQGRSMDQAASASSISVFVGLFGGGRVPIRQEENLQVRHSVLHHSGVSAICDFAIRMRFVLRLRVAILRFLLYFAEQHARFC